MAIEAIVFDMDGVLFDTERLYVDAFYEAAAKLALADMDAAIHAVVGMSNADTRRWFAANMAADFPVEEYMQTVRACFFAALDRGGLPIKEGTPELLAYLREQGVPIALATSARRASVAHHFDVAGWDASLFDAIVTGDMVANGKPAPDIYVSACEALGVAPENAVAVEDSFNGIRAAHAAGMLPVMVPDLTPPTDEIAALLYRRFDSLVDMQRWLKTDVYSR